MPLLIIKKEKIFILIESGNSKNNYNEQIKLPSSNRKSLNSSNGKPIKHIHDYVIEKINKTSRMDLFLKDTPDTQTN